MAGPVAGGHFVVGGRSLVGIAHQNGDRGAEGQPIVDAGKNLGAVCLIARRHNLGLTRSPPVQLDLNLRLAHGNPRRTAVNDHPHAAAVRLAKGVNAENFAKRGRHAGG